MFHTIMFEVKLTTVKHTSNLHPWQAQEFVRKALEKAVNECSEIANLKNCQVEVAHLDDFRRLKRLKWWITPVKIKKLKSLGLSTKEISELMGCSTVHVNKLLRSKKND